MKLIKLFFKYALNIIIAVNQLINVIFFGHPKETISCRLGRAKNNKGLYGKFALVVCTVLSFFHACHCEKAHEKNIRFIRDIYD